MLDRWVGHRVAVDGVEPEHAARCLDAAQRFVEWCGAGPETVTLLQVAEWTRARYGVVSRKRVANELAMLRSLGDYLCLVGARRDNPWRQFRLARVRRARGYDGLTPDEANAIIAVAERQARDSDGRRASHGRRRATWYRFLLATGLRWNEARRQQWDDIDLTRGSIVVTADKARRRDALPLSPETVAMLLDWRRESTGVLVFPHAIHRKVALRDMHEAGVDRGVGLFHRWRVAFVTRLIDAKVSLADVSHLARHRTIDQTLRYDRPRADRLRAAAGRIWESQPAKRTDFGHGGQESDGKMLDRMGDLDDIAHATRCLDPPSHACLSPPTSPAQF